MTDDPRPRGKPGPKGPLRPATSVRLGADVTAGVDQLAVEAAVNRSETIRRLVVAGVADKRTRAKVIHPKEPKP